MDKEILTLLRDLATLNLDYRTREGEVILGIGRATNLVQDAQRLLEKHSQE